MEFEIEKCAMLIMKSKKYITDEKELPNQGRIRTPGEKENYKHMGILEADTIKQVETKEKKYETSTSDERENFSKLISTAVISWKE